MVNEPVGPGRLGGVEGSIGQGNDWATTLTLSLTCLWTLSERHWKALPTTVHSFLRFSSCSILELSIGPSS